MTAKARWILLAIALLATAGVVLSSVSLHQHYAKDRSTYCDLGGNFNCDSVNRSIYSSIAGIPVALIGILGYLAVLALATVYRSKAETPALLVAGSVAGLAFALYLTYVEKFVLATWCILCLSSLAVIAGIALLAVVLALQTRKRRNAAG